MCQSMHVCIYIRLYVCMYVCLCVCICTHTHNGARNSACPPVMARMLFRASDNGRQELNNFHSE